MEDRGESLQNIEILQSLANWWRGEEGDIGM